MMSLMLPPGGQDAWQHQAVQRHWRLVSIKLATSQRALIMLKDPPTTLTGTAHAGAAGEGVVYTRTTPPCGLGPTMRWQHRRG